MEVHGLSISKVYGEPLFTTETVQGIEMMFQTCMKFKEQNYVIIVKNLLWMGVSNMSIILLSTSNVVIWLVDVQSKEDTKSVHRCFTPMDPGIVLIAPIYSYSSQFPHIVHVLPTSCQREFECMNLRPCRNLQSINTIASFVPLVGPPRTIMLGCN